MLFSLGLAYGLGGVIAAAMLSRAYIGPLGVCITALGLVETMQVMFKRHRDASWSSHGEAAQPAAAELLGSLMAVLLGVVSAFAYRIQFPARHDQQAFFVPDQRGFIHQLVPYSTSPPSSARQCSPESPWPAWHFSRRHLQDPESHFSCPGSFVMGHRSGHVFRSGEAADAIDIALVMLSLATGL